MLVTSNDLDDLVLLELDCKEDPELVQLVLFDGKLITKHLTLVAAV